MELDRSAFRNPYKFLGYKLNDISHYGNIGIRLSQSRQCFFRGKIFKLKQPEIFLQNSRFQSIRTRIFFRCHENTGNDISPGMKCLKDSLAKIPLTNNDNTHGKTPA